MDEGKVLDQSVISLIEKFMYANKIDIFVQLFGKSELRIVSSVIAHLRNNTLSTEKLVNQYIMYFQK
jgi:hypothetical protein